MVDDPPGALVLPGAYGAGGLDALAVSEVVALGLAVGGQVVGCAEDVLAYFERARTKITLNGRLEHLRGLALGFRNLIPHYIARALLEAGGLRPRQGWGQKERQLAQDDPFDNS